MIITKQKACLWEAQEFYWIAHIQSEPLLRDMPFFLRYMMLTEATKQKAQQVYLNAIPKHQAEITCLKQRRKSAIFVALIDDLIEAEQQLINQHLTLLQEVD